MQSGYGLRANPFASTAITLLNKRVRRKAEIIVI